MGKNYNCLLQIDYRILIIETVESIRHAAQRVPVFRDSKNGGIRITLIPLSGFADVWLGGGMSKFGADGTANDICRREFIFKINPEGVYVIQAKDPEDGHVEPVNCCGYSALKTEYALWKDDFDRKASDPKFPETLEYMLYCKSIQYFCEENGWSTHEGSVVTIITLDGKGFMKLAICVSGAESKEDEQCALVGMMRAQAFFERCARWINERKYQEHGEEFTVDFKLLPDFVSIQET